MTPFRYEPERHDAPLTPAEVFVEHKTVEGKLAAVRKWGGLPRDPRALPTLQAALADREEKVALAAVHALGLHSAAGYRRALWALDNHASSKVRVAAAKTIARTAKPDELLNAQQLLANTNDPAWPFAARVLAYCPQPQALALLSQALADEHRGSEKAHAAAFALCVRGDRAALHVLERTPRPKNAMVDGLVDASRHTRRSHAIPLLARWLLHPSLFAPKVLHAIHVISAARARNPATQNDSAVRGARLVLQRCGVSKRWGNFKPNEDWHVFNALLHATLAPGGLRRLSNHRTFELTRRQLQEAHQRGRAK